MFSGGIVYSITSKSRSNVRSELRELETIENGNCLGRAGRDPVKNGHYLFEANQLLRQVRQTFFLNYTNKLSAWVNVVIRILRVAARLRVAYIGFLELQGKDFKRKFVKFIVRSLCRAALYENRAGIFDIQSANRGILLPRGLA